jgi:hypothetical protein
MTSPCNDSGRWFPRRRGARWLRSNRKRSCSRGLVPRRCRVPGLPDLVAMGGRRVRLSSVRRDRARLAARRRHQLGMRAMQLADERDGGHDLAPDSHALDGVVPCGLGADHPRERGVRAGRSAHARAEFVPASASDRHSSRDRARISSTRTSSSRRVKTASQSSIGNPSSRGSAGLVLDSELFRLQRNPP